MLGQAASLKVSQLDIKTTSKKPRVELIDLLPILQIKLTSSYSRQIDVIFSTWIRRS